MKELILEVVQRNSGGVKMTKLLSDLIVLDNTLWTWELDDLLSRVEKELEDTPELGLLDYVWDMGGGRLRAKQFIYLKIPEVSSDK